MSVVWCAKSGLFFVMKPFSLSSASGGKRESAGFDLRRLTYKALVTNSQDMFILKRCMKKPLRFVLTAAFLIFPPGIEAAKWSSVISNEKMRAEIDLASLLRQGGIVTAWDREVYSELEQARPGDFYFKSAKSLMRYNCNARTADLLMKVYYAEDGS